LAPGAIILISGFAAGVRLGGRLAGEGPPRRRRPGAARQDAHHDPHRHGRPRWFREQVNAAGGGNYQTSMNDVLRRYIEGREELQCPRRPGGTSGHARAGAGYFGALHVAEEVRRRPEVVEAVTSAARKRA